MDQPLGRVKGVRRGTERFWKRGATWMAYGWFS